MKEIRTCIVCKRKKNKHELIRIVSENRKPVIDTNFKINARGIYICNDKECLNKLLKHKNLGKIIKIDINEKDLIDLIEKLGENQIGKN